MKKAEKWMGAHYNDRWTSATWFSSKATNSASGRLTDTAPLVDASKLGSVRATLVSTHFIFSLEAKLTYSFS